MKVVFLKDMKGQGKKGEVKEVSEGYARNFLIPRGVVSPASEGNVKQAEELKKGEQKRKEREKEEAIELGKKLEEITVQIKTKAGEGGRLFGSITSSKIGDELAKLKLKIDKRKLVLDEPIRSLGVTQVPVKLHPEVTAKLKVHVMEE
ncbi:50S ribosomal protein L9 [Paenibacillus sp. y28]|uniref:50S ribosomal protein L9 n=1 Tax=Paenibacillus sp. y28 TaxID=3129110 RepID=UPI00301813E4